MAEAVNDTVEETGEVLLPALITRTSAEVLGRRPLPRVVRERPAIFVLGPNGVGKTTVARRLTDVPGVRVIEFRSAVVTAARERAWSRDLREAPALLLDDVDFLHNRLGAQELLGKLLRERAIAGRRTVLCQGQPDTSVTLLYTAVPLSLRATVLLRFPVGRGRRRHVLARCEARGIDYAEARSAVQLEPWTYEGVERALDSLVRL
jgi:hypothetical protein